MNTLNTPPLKHIIEAALLVAGRAMSLPQIEALFEDDPEPPDRDFLRAALAELEADYAERAIELVEVAGGFRLQSRESVERWVGRLFKERTPRYSRALLETLVLIAYRQPITRGEIEEVRGVAVSSTIIRTLQEREWIKVIGYKEVPGRPALLGTTKQFLDYFNLKRLDDLPPLAEIKDLDALDSVLARQLGIVTPDMQGKAANDAATGGQGEQGESGDQAESGERTAAGDGHADAADTSQVEGVEDAGTVDSGRTGATPATGAVDAGGESDEPQTQLKRVIASFATEHRQELQVLRDQEQRHLLRNLHQGDDPASLPMHAEDTGKESSGDGDSDEDTASRHDHPPFSDDPPDSTDTLH